MIPSGSPGVRTLSGVLVLLVAWLFLSGSPILDRHERALYDLRMQARPPRPASGQVALVVIDERAVAEYGRWPWPRNLHARLVSAIAAEKASLLAFTVAFQEPDSGQAVRLADRLEAELRDLGPLDVKVREALAVARADADTDGAFAEALRASKMPVVLGYPFHRDAREAGSVLPVGEIMARLDRLSASEMPRRGLPPERGVPGIPQAYAPEPSLTSLSQATPWAGFLDMPLDSDGIVRRAGLVAVCRDRVFPSFALMVAWLHLGRPPWVAAVSEAGIEGVVLGNRFLHTDERGVILVDHGGPPGRLPSWSAAEVLSGQLPPGALQGKAVILGGTVKGLRDELPTSVFPLHPGLEIHGEIVENLILGTPSARPDWHRGLDLMAILGLGGLAALLLPVMPARFSWVAALAMGAGHIYLADILDEHGIWMVRGYPLLALILVFAQVVLSRYLQAERERRQVEVAFGQYVAPDVMQQMLAQPSRLRLGGEERLLTVLFSDLARFTATSEKHRPAEMAELMAGYFEAMTEEILAEKGLLKEYVGDQIMAIFGAPLEDPEHALRACRAALAMQKRLTSLRATWAAQGLPPLSARTSVNTGTMLVGNLGSRFRFSYGVLGDAVNLGSRLEGMCSEYGTGILVGEATAGLVGTKLQMREVDRVRVKGRNEPVTLYELVCESADRLTPQQKLAFARYAEGLALYRAAHFGEAIESFDAALAQLPDDGPSGCMRRRAAILQAEPPAPDWGGVFTHRVKG